MTATPHRFLVSVARDRTEYADVEVEAANERDAISLALNAAINDASLAWTLDTTTVVGGPYLGGAPELIPEEIQ